MEFAFQKHRTRLGTVVAAVGIPLLGALPVPGSAVHAQNLDPNNIGLKLSRTNLTMVGVVTRDPIDNRFVVLAANGLSYRIRGRWGLPPTLSAGDRVRAHGEWKDGMLDAGNIRILAEGSVSDDATRYKPPVRTVRGVVVKINDGKEFVVRTRNHWTYPVVALWGKPDTLSVGDRVRAYGAWTGGALQAGSLRILFDGSVLEDASDADEP